MNALPKDWLRLAQEDLEVAELLFKEKRWPHVYFHAQQTAEIRQFALRINQSLLEFWEMIEFAWVASKA